MKIRAAVLEEFGQPLVVQEVALAGPRAGEVLVRLHACGVCHTDMYTASGVDPSGYSPCVLGHEGAGVVEEVGEGVASLAPGEPGSTCVVFGAGMVGLGAVVGCRLQGAERIVCVDPSEERRELARRHGATDTWVADEHVVDRVLEETGGFGADFTFEATGVVAVMRQAVESARMGWGVCCVTGVAARGETLDIVPRYLITGRKVMGASFGGVKGREQVPQLVERFVAGDIDALSFISHRIGLDEVNEGFDLMHHQD